MKSKIAILLSLVATLAVSSVASAKESAGRQWPANQQVSIDQIDHSAFDQLLKRYVDVNGRVNYAAWHQSRGCRDQLTTYLANLSRANPDQQASREARLAYWINAYNAVTIEGILRVYPTKSIRDHTAKLVGYNIWKDLLFTAGDTKISLEDIEHKVLRKMGEPRIHFAIVCASIGCPRLLNQAYVADQLQQQLAANTQDFFSRQQNLQVTGNTLNLSQIINWFGSDFGGTQQQQVQVLSRYFPPAAQQLVASGNYSVKFQEYDWGLNTQ